MPTPLGDYLRSARGRLTPQELGLPVSDDRRVSGLRREEVALLAGVSADYYMRLEQGRERSPSVQVLDSLGEALRLDDDGRLHLYHLAGFSPRPASSSPDRVDPALVELMSSWSHNPALVLGRAYDVLAANRMGAALFSGFPYSDNLLIKVFCDPASRSFYADWRTSAANTVAGFRLAEGAARDDPRIRQVVDELLQRSPEFRQMWRENTARGKSIEAKRFVHPEVGPLTLRMQSFDVRSAPGQQLVTYHADRGSPSAEALDRLARSAASAAPDGG